VGFAPRDHHFRMPSSTIALPCGRDARPPLVQRTLARLRAHGLDRRIARGADPASAPLLATRADALVRRATRDELADDLERVLHLARTREPWRLGAVPVRAYEVADAAGPLRDLRQVLRGPHAVAPRGVAIARGLVHDGTAPVYARAPGAPSPGWRAPR
jgi:hypothetical protein